MCEEVVQNQGSNKRKIKPGIFISISEKEESDPEDMSVLENVSGKV
jgi:hypothetical protein